MLSRLIRWSSDRRRGARLLLLCCLALSRAAGAAHDEDLRPVAPASPLEGRLAAVGSVYGGGYGADFSLASGFLITPCHVLTAGHVLARLGAGVRKNAEVRFVLRHVRGQPPLGLPGRVVAASEEFTMQANPVGFDPGRVGNDWALIELQRPIANVAPIRLLYPEAPLPEGARFTVAGYPMSTLRQGLYVHESCPNWAGHGVQVPAGMLIADCAVRQGMSGGPLLLDDEGGMVAAGIIAERFTVGDKVMTVGVAVGAFAEKMEAALRDSDVCAAGAPYTWPPAERH